MFTQSRGSTPALIALALGYFTFGTASLAVVGLSTPLSRDLHVPAARVGVMVSVFALTFAVAALIAPTFLGRLERKQVLLLGLAIMTLGSLASALTPSYPALLAARVVGAFGAAIYAPSASAAGSMLVAEERRSRALATVFAGMTAAAVLGVPLASFWGAHVGWRWTFGVIAALTALALALVLALLPHLEQGARPSSSSYRSVITTRGALPAVLTTLFYMAGQFTVYGVAGAFITQRSGATATQVALVLFAFGVMGVLGNAAGAPVYERYGGTRTIAVALLGIALAFLGLGALPTGVTATGALFAFWAFFSQMYQAPQQARLVTLVPVERALVLSLNAATMYVGISLGGLLGGTLLPHVGTRWLAVLGLVPICLAAALHLASSHSRPVSTPGASTAPAAASATT